MERPLLKKPKLEESVDGNGSERGRGTRDVDSININNNNNNKEEEEEEVDEQEEALVALIAHRANEVEHNKQRASYYKSQVEVSERKLKESQSQLARFRSRRKSVSFSSQSTPINSNNNNNNISTSNSNGYDETREASPSRSRPQSHSRPQLVIPALNPKTTTHQQQGGQGRTVFSKPSSAITGTGGSSRPNSSSSTPASTAIEKPPKLERPSPVRSHEKKQQQPKKRIFEQREHQELITSIRSNVSPNLITFQSGNQICSQHKRKLRCLALSPVNDQIFVTSALDGVVNLWQVHSKGSGASLLSTTDCVSPKQRRWPEDIAWHPDGDSLVAVYSADGGDSQISILNLNLSGEKKVVFLQEKPHLKGIINSILFMPWADATFATGGSDHAVMLWHEKDGSWKPKSLHREQHSSAVMGVAGLQQKKVILSVGADKRIVGFDLLSGRSDFKHQIESKCMSVLPNPSDFNLFMVQTGTPGKQLRLFDIRRRQTEIHTFGWKQESSESQSALINQSWSPDGLYLSSGSADPMIHIFDIRYNGSKPSQSVQAHQKRVFKAVWHQSLPLLTSISSDLNIGLHRIT